MDDQVFEDVIGQAFGTNQASLNGSTTATAVMDPETAGWVTEDPVAPKVDEPSPQQPGGAPAVTDENSGQQTVPQNIWDSDNNPYKAQAMQAQQKINQSLQYLQAMQAQQQMAEYDTMLQQRIEQLPELTPEQQAIEVRQIVAEREALRDMAYQQVIQQKEQQTEAIARNQVIAMLGQKYELTQSELRAMMAMNDPWRMEEYANMAKSARQNAMQEVEQLKVKLSQYESGQAARQRMASGADRVGTAQATSSVGRPPQPKNFDEFWEQWVSQ